MPKTVAEYAATQNAYNDRIDKAIDGLVADNKTLNDLIKQLQSTQGTLTAEDQALLDQIEQRAAAQATKLEALDAQTENPPEPPTT